MCSLSGSVSWEAEEDCTWLLALSHSGCLLPRQIYLGDRRTHLWHCAADSGRFELVYSSRWHGQSINHLCFRGGPCKGVSQATLALLQLPSFKTEGEAVTVWRPDSESRNNVSCQQETFLDTGFRFITPKTCSTSKSLFC